MARQRDDDLFADSTMTFGEHLEELRVCLTRSLIGLTLGFLLGLLIADRVVLWIQSPLEDALKEHYSLLAKMRLDRLYADDVPKELEDFVVGNELIFEELYVEQRELRRWAEAAEEKPAKEPAPDSEDPTDGLSASKVIMHHDPLPAPDPEMVLTRIWRPAEARLTALSPHESFVLWLKAGFVAGLIIASPYIFYQLWLFVAAGLYSHERNFVYIFLPFSLLLFISGAAMAFFFVFGPVLNFLFGFARRMEIAPDLRISEVISFVLFLPLGFGIAFQLPLVMLFMNRIGIFSVQAYLEKWRIAILVIFVISMLLTPADPVSMLLMAVPLTALYFLGIALCHWMPKSRNPFAEAEVP
jgi:sec-independent protein translocase protein TatC